MSLPQNRDELPWPHPLYAWYTVGLLSIAYAIAFIDRMVLNLLIEPIRADLSLTDTQMSFLSGASFAIFYVVLGLPIGRLADRRSRRTIIALGMALWSVMTAACGLSRGFWMLFLARMGVGVGEATLSPSASSLISDYFPPQRLARGMAVYASGISFGIGLSLIVGGAVFQAVSEMTLPDIPIIGTISAWQATFLAVSLPGLVLAAAMYTVREPARRGVQPGGKDPTRATLHEVVTFVKDNRRTFIPLGITFSMTSVLTYGASAWMAPYFMRVHGWTVGQVGWNYGWIMFVCGPAGTLAGGWLADRLRTRGHLDARLRATGYAMLVLTPLGFLAPTFSQIDFAVPALALLWFVASMPLSLGYTAVQEIAPNQMRGLLSALLLFVTTITGMGFGPTIVALLTDYVFGNPQALPYSIALTVGLAAAAAAMAAWWGCRGMAASVAAAGAWQGRTAVAQ